MKIIITFIFLLSISKVVAQNKDSLVFYANKIDWSLFKGKPDTSSFGAVISTSMYFESVKTNIWTGVITFRVHAFMKPSKSWVKPGYTDEYTLEHEQIHFTIAEIFARGLQTELNNIKINSQKSPLIQATFDKWLSKLEIEQKKYDFETRHGNNTIMQKMWSEKVKAELNTTRL